MMRIGFAGLGRMGRPMALNLVKAGHEVVVFNRSPGPIDQLVQAGATSAASPTEVAQRVDIFCACLATPELSRDVFLGPLGAVQADRPGLLCIDFATVEPDTARHIGAGLAARGIGFIDAPISGGSKRAQSATLAVMAGGSAEDFERARPILEQIGNSIFHLGPVGAGVTAKICNNAITGAAHVLIAEAMVLGAKAGIAPQRLFDVLRVSSARSHTLERIVGDIFLPRKFGGGDTTLASMIKDLECAIATAKTLGVRLLLPAVAQQCYIEAAGLGHDEKHPAAVILPMEAIAGTTVKPA
jgi:3-hydroxyisobutyrate dehydrogenase-like beta-hydroxyacid dehydrogenase